MRNYSYLFLLLLGLVFFSCSAGGDDSAGTYNSSQNNLNNANNGANVNIGGVQDIGLFREIIEAGDIPAPSTLDANGFFSEHYLEYPFGACEENLCLNGMVGRGVNLVSKDHMNALQVVMKSFDDPSEHTRPPTDFIAVIDVSGSMYTDGKLQQVKEGLHLMVNGLQSDDRLSIISYTDWASEVLPLTFADSTENTELMHSAISSLQPMGSTNIYDGLQSAFDTALLSGAEDRYARVVFLSDGLPTAGITDEAAIIGMARESVSHKVQLTSIGVGYDVNFDLMRELAMAGGNFYFVEDNSSLLDIFVQEVDFFAYPLAQDIQISLTSSSSFYAGDSVGFDQWETTSNGGSAFIPAVYAASRTSSSTEDPHSRRGGGSALFIRLVPMDDSRDLNGMVLSMAYTDPETLETVRQEIPVASLAGEDGIVPVDSFWSEDVMQKSFLMLNLYLSLKEVCQRASNYQYYEAGQLLSETIAHARQVNEVLLDDDISNDIILMDQLLLNLGYYEDPYGYCDEGDCYYDDYYYENESVDYGCSSSGSPEGAFSLLFAFLMGLFLIKRVRQSVR